MAGYGVGALVFNEILTPVINPDQLNFQNPCFEGASYGCYPLSVDENFRKMFLVLIGCYAGFAVIGIVFIWQGPIVTSSDWVSDVRYLNSSSMKGSLQKAEKEDFSQEF